MIVGRSTETASVIDYILTSGSQTTDALRVFGPVPRIGSLLIKPASALCNLDCSYCFYLDRDTDPYAGLAARKMSTETLERLVSGFLEYSYPNSTFAFQGGEPTLCGLRFYETLIELQLRHGRDGQTISNALQTNGMFIDESWCKFFSKGKWLVGISLDGPEAIHDEYRRTRNDAGTWRRVMQSVEMMQKHRVEFNVLCVVSQANVHKARELYRFYRSTGVDNLQFIPLAEFAPDGTPLPFTIAPAEYGRFLSEMFDLWWPHRRKMRIRCFDNFAEALACHIPGACTMQRNCDSYVVVEYNGDVFPCDFFVEREWKLGNINEDTFDSISRRRARLSFARRKQLHHTTCDACEYETLCWRGCPHTRRARAGDPNDLDYFCESYKMIYSKAVQPLAMEVKRLLTGGRNRN
jgi:uncharacterized protein